MMAEYLDTQSFREAEAAEKAKWDRLRAEHPDVELVALCLSGWLPLVERFLAEAKSVLPEGSTLTRVKATEKWAMLTLHYRIEPPDSEAYRAVATAAWPQELASRSMCEICGWEGRVRKGDGWLVTRCDRHAKNHLPGGDELEMLEEATRLQRESEAGLGRRMPDGVKIELAREAYNERLILRPQHRDTLALHGMADVLGRDDDERLALAEAFQSH